MTDDIEREAEAEAACVEYRRSVTAGKYEPMVTKAFKAGYRARAAEQAKPETRQTHDIFAPGFSAADWLREHAAERAGEPQQPSTRELIATVRAGIGGQRLPSHQEGIEADEALTELEKRMGGE